MPIQVKWDDDHHAHQIIRITFIGRWTWDEFFEAFVIRLIPPAPPSAHYIVDLFQSRGIPADTLTRLQQIEMSHPAAGKVVVIGIYTSLDILFTAVARLRPTLRKRVVFLRTEREAYAFLAPYLTS